MIDNKNMDKIVEKGLKIDLHIHSFCSKHRESGDLTSNCKFKDIDKLANILSKNKLDVVAISDHDVFSYKYYKQLKTYEGKPSFFQKVFPAVEFSVAIKNDKNKEWPVHIIAIFNDEDDKGVKRIEKVLGSADNEEDPSKNVKPNYNALNKQYFSEERFIELLNKINLDVVFIAHQKQTLTSEHKPKNNDANGVGKEKFNEFIFSEYFQALEFRDKKNELFNVKSQKVISGDLLRFITGSDCHDWDNYPRHDSNSSLDYKHTYLKCLPCFRGLALALTDSSRISLVDSFFSTTNVYLDKIDLTINGKPKTIPLSKGINAIIGDNSIGKSLLVHKITNYYRLAYESETSAINDAIKNSYENYLRSNNIVVNNLLDKDNIYAFDSQGEIRLKFALNHINRAAFISKRAPVNESIRINKDKTTSIINNYIEYLKTLSSIKNRKDILEKSKVIFSDKILEPVVLKVQECSYELSNEKIGQIDIYVNKLHETIDAIDSIKDLFNDDERELLEKTKIIILNKKAYWLAKRQIENDNIFILSVINSSLSVFDKNQTKTTDDKEIEAFNNSKSNLINAIYNSCIHSDNLELKNPSIESTNVETKSLPYGDYKIIKKCSVQKVDNDYLLSLVKNPLKANCFKLDSFFSDSQLSSAISRRDSNLDPWEDYSNRLTKLINNDFTEKISINYLDEPDTVDHSSGFNERMYFKVLSEDKNSPGVYIIDQPEDDISQTAIRDELLNDLKNMSRTRQIILITHNPQFVVNLDVDNVIYIHKDNEIKIDSGALEYNQNNEDILKDVAEALDGGVYTIRKRWKRYEKNIDDII